MSVTPQPALTTVVTTAGNAEDALPPDIAGGWITNPPDAPGYLYVNPINNATQEATGETFALAPGQTWSAIPGQTTATSVNSETSGHEFSAIYWLET